MRSLLVALLAATLAGCGGDSPTPAPPPPDALEERVDEAQEALDMLDETDLPEDAKRELEEAKRLLEDAQR